MSFNVVAAEVFDLYGREDYDGALAVVESARAEYPQEGNRLTFWEACLLSRKGKPDSVLEVMQGGLERGEWWPPGMLADEDLDPVRRLTGWDSIIRQCTVIADERRSHRPAPIVRAGTEGGGMVVAIQGAQGVQEQVASTWADAVPSEWAIVTPAASEPDPSGGWMWPHSVEACAEAICGDLESLNMTRPVVAAGFSIGSAIASQLALADTIPVDALIAVAPSSDSGFDEVREIARQGVPALVICGDQDIRRDDYRKLKADLVADAHVTVDLRQKLGHEYPDDLGEPVSRFLSRLGMEA